MHCIEWLCFLMTLGDS